MRKRNEDSIVLDPFCGTGTVMVEAMHNGWNSIGVDINPVAALIAKVKTTAICEERLQAGMASIATTFSELNHNGTDPREFENIDYWFDEKTIQTLTKIRHCIDKISDRDVADFYRVVFSSIIKDVSKADPRIYVPVLPRPGYEVDTPDAWLLFKTTAERSIRDLIEFSSMVRDLTTSCRIFCQDIRDFACEYTDVDLIITSPPYISAQKYVRSTRLEAYWLDYGKDEQLEVNKKTIGTERVSSRYYSDFHCTGHKDLDRLLRDIFEKNQERAGITSKYFLEIRAVLTKLHSILSQGGILILVIGTNTVAKYKVNTNEILAEMCKAIGFAIERIMIDRIPSRGLMTRRNGTAGMIDYEWVIQMRKTRHVPCHI